MITTSIGFVNVFDALEMSLRFICAKVLQQLDLFVEYIRRKILFKSKKRYVVLFYKDALGMFWRAISPVSAADVLINCWICLKFGWLASRVSWRTMDSNVVRNAPACRIWSNAYIINDFDYRMNISYWRNTCRLTNEMKQHQRRHKRDSLSKEDQWLFVKHMRVLRYHR